MTAYVHLGIDSSGRPVRMSPAFRDVWEQVVATLGFRPVITQGGWLAKAAAASATTHAGDAIDLRVWNLTVAQREATVRVLRAHGVAAWFRDWSDPHIHAVPGRWAHPSPSALRQWDDCRNGLDGLAAKGPDPHTYPLATTPPEADDMTPEQDKRLTRVENKLDRLLEQEKARYKAERLRDKKRFQKLRDFAKGNAAMLDAIDTAITELDEEN